MMAESVNDVATVQRTLQRSLEATEDELVAQARLTRDLQDDLLRTRMVEFEGLSDRLYRVVRQTAKETGKQVRLDIVGGSIEVDRGVLDRMTRRLRAPAAQLRRPRHRAAGGAHRGRQGPDRRRSWSRSRTRATRSASSSATTAPASTWRASAPRRVAMRPDRPDSRAHDDAELANLIFTPGFSTVDKVTELAGRGVGMDVVRSEVIAMGGRIETATAAGQGTSFKLILPLTTAVTQVVMLRCGESDRRRAVDPGRDRAPRQAARRSTPPTPAAPTSSATARCRSSGSARCCRWARRRPTPAGRTRTVVVVRSAQQRIAVHVDEVLGNQEVVVKNLGPQLSRLPGLAGMTLLASGAVALIYNPVALATLYGDAARAASQAARAARRPACRRRRCVVADAPPAAPLVLVVDDSLTVRRVTQRLLVREGYRVTLAKDGLDALERLAEEVPQVVLSDIEMPRMDGFDLVRNIRADARWRDLPIIMITSRIAEKHRDHAAELGVDHYLGKPYSEEDLLALIAPLHRPPRREA